MKKLIFPFFLLIMAFDSAGQSADIGNFIADYVHDHQFNGTILIQKNGLILYEQSFGLASRAFAIPVRNETRYKIASITKIFTSVIVMKLAEEGKIDLAKPIGTYLPDYTGEGAEKVTVHELLNHTSGMVNIDTITSIASALKNGVPVYQKALTTDQLLRNYCSDSLVTEPGKVFSYNNAEYIILGKIIEQICGKPFSQVLNEMILKPLDMVNSGMLNQSDIIDGLADTYFYREDLGRLVNDLPVYIQNWYASGAMYSTVTDLLKFSDALLGYKIVKKESLDLIFTPGLDDYGYGVWSYETEINNKKYKTIKRPGRIMGAQGMLVYMPEASLITIILSNTSLTDLDGFVYQINKKMLQ
jgi:D-alanyl-D-alanine carboxypeptidase